MYQIEQNMPARELAEWYAHFHLSHEEQKKDEERAKRKAGKL